MQFVSEKICKENYQTVSVIRLNASIGKDLKGFDRLSH
jgi:hypothetical protein